MRLNVSESHIYTVVVPEDAAVVNSVVVRQEIVCSLHIECQYYSSILVSFLSVCYFCGMGEESLVNDDEMKELT